VEGRRDGERPLGWHHSGSRPDEERVGEEPAEPSQRGAHRRLRQTDPSSSTRHAALDQQRIESHEQVEVDIRNIHCLDSPHIHNELVR
jgi:hypothetical protein